MTTTLREAVVDASINTLPARVFNSHKTCYRMYISNYLHFI